MTTYTIGFSASWSRKERSVTADGISVFSGRALSVSIESATITDVRETRDRQGLPYLAPGFTDMQVNGYRGIDYSSPSFAETDLERLVVALARSGTTKHLPTIISGPRELMVRNLSIITRARNSSEELRAAIPGYHVEGPFISPEDGPRGAHSRAYVREVDYEEYRAWQDAADGLVRIVTVAPEVPGALDFIERVSREGVLAAIGHTGASPEIIRDAIKAGARLSTHLGNGSHAMVPRLKNYLWEQLGSDSLTAGIIADGYHLPESVVRTIARAKGSERLFLVSDVAVHGGADPGVYPWGDIMVEVFPDGHLGLHETEFLAGAGHLLDRDIAQFIRFSGASLGDAVRLCTTVPARLLGLAVEDEVCAVGGRANLAVFDYEAGGDSLKVRKTIAGGRVLFER